MADTRQVLQDLWADTPMKEDGSIVERHVTNFMIYAVGFGLITGVVTAVLVAGLGVIGAVLSLPIDLFVAYKVVTKLFVEVDALVSRRIRRREGNLAENLSD